MMQQKNEHTSSKKLMMQLFGFLFSEIRFHCTRWSIKPWRRVGIGSIWPVSTYPNYNNSLGYVWKDWLLWKKNTCIWPEKFVLLPSCSLVASPFMCPKIEAPSWISSLLFPFFFWLYNIKASPIYGDPYEIWLYVVRRKFNLTDLQLTPSFHKMIEIAEAPKRS